MGEKVGTVLPDGEGRSEDQLDECRCWSHQQLGELNIMVAHSTVWVAGPASSALTQAVAATRCCDTPGQPHTCP